MDSATPDDVAAGGADDRAPQPTWRRPTLRRYGTVRGETSGADMTGTDGIGNLS
jgi:hypothetical protein